MSHRLPRWIVGIIVTLLLLGSGPLMTAAATMPMTARGGEGTPTADFDGHGIDVDDMDLSTDPVDDFYQFANGSWLDDNELAADESSYSNFNELGNLAADQIYEVFNELVDDPSLVAGSDPWKAATVYEQGIDEDARNEAGIEPVEPILNEIAGIDNLDDLSAYQTTASLYNLYGLLSMYVDQSFEDSTRYDVFMVQPFLGLGNRDYYEDDADLEDIQQGYMEAIAGMLAETGMDEDDATDAAQDVFDFETQIVEQLWTTEESSNLSDVVTVLTRDEMKEKVSWIDWDAYFASLGLEDAETAVNTEMRSFESLDKLVRDTDLEVIRNYLTFEVLWSYSGYLSDDIYDIYFDFQGPTFFGVDQPLDIISRTLGDVSDIYGDVIGQRYVEEFFPPEAKAQIEELVAQVIAAFRIRLEENPWLSDEGRAAALEKLDKLIVKVGYPDEWASYTTYSIGTNYGESVVSAYRSFYVDSFARYGEPVDRTDWSSLPQVVNAYYTPQDNSITFPAGILQAPYFDFEADPASNFGAIGAVIGHEITHAFDQRGSQFDGDGNLSNWWTDEDREAFNALNQRVIDQFGAIEALPGTNIDGLLTAGENVADLGGVQVAYDALMLNLEENGDPGEIDGFTQQQRFFIAWATAWREEIRPEYLQSLLTTDEHSPSDVRGVEPLRNMDEFYEAFGIEDGDAMYLPEDERIVVW